MKKILYVIIDVGKGFLDFIEWITGGTEGAETLRDVIEGLIAAFITYKGVMIAYNTVVKAGKKAVDLYRKAQQLLNATNPFGWIVIAVSGLVGLETSLRGLTPQTEKIYEKFSQLSDIQIELSDNVKGFAAIDRK